MELHVFKLGDCGGVNFYVIPRRALCVGITGWTVAIEKKLDTQFP